MIMTELQDKFDEAYEAVDDLFHALLKSIEVANNEDMSAEINRGLKSSLSEVSMMISNHLTDDGKIANKIEGFNLELKEKLKKSKKK